MVTPDDVKENDGICFPGGFQKMSVITFLSWLLDEDFVHRQQAHPNLSFTIS